MTALAPTRRALLAEALRATLALVTVVAVAAALLAALDGVPALITGEPRDLRRAGTVDEVERRLRTRLVVPSFFPSSLAWPPGRVSWVAGPPGAVALSVAGRDGAPRLLIAQTLGPGSIPQSLVPEADVLERTPVAVGTAPGTLSRVVEDGVMAWQVTWVQGGRTLLLRSRGTLDELLRMARSAREAP